MSNKKAVKDEAVCFRLTAKEKERVVKLSKAMGITVSELFQTFLTSAIAEALIKFELRLERDRKETIKL